MDTLSFGLGYLLVGLDVLLHGPPYGIERVLPVLGALERFFLVQLGFSESELRSLQEIWAEISPHITEPWILQYREQFLSTLKESPAAYKNLWLIQMSALASFHQLLLGEIPFAPQYYRVKHYGRYVGLPDVAQEYLLPQGLLWAYQLWEMGEALRQSRTVL